MNTAFTQVTLQDWENQVKKQLKTDDIYSVLKKENLEEIEVKPYYNEVSKPLKNLPKIEESTQLVSTFHDEWANEAYAFLLDENTTGLNDKSLFIDNKELSEHIIPEENNRYFSLIDPFSEKDGTLNVQLVKELLAKGFERSIGVDVSLHQNAGAKIYQQLGIALSKTKELTEVFGEKILDQIVFRIAIGSNYFFEISKIRAFKLIFNQFSKEFDKNSIPYIFAETSLRNKTKNDEENNLIRSTLELAAAMIGGADAVFANDYKMKDKTTLSEEISFKQEIVLAYESIINVFDDAADGSFYVEEISQQMAEKAWKYFLEIEENGGYLESLKNGKIQKDVYSSAVAEQKWVEEGKIKLIGVNLYPKLEATKTAEGMYSEYEIKKVRWSEMYE